MTKMLGLIVPLLVSLSCTSSDRGTVMGNDGTGDSILGSRGLSASHDEDERATATIDEASGTAGGNATEGTCTSTANCGQSSPVSCTSSESTGVCSAGVDQNCGAGQQGYAECDGARTYCPACGCTEGATRSLPGTGCCCGGLFSDDPSEQNLNPGDYWPQHLRLFDTCIHGAWVTTGSACDGGACAGGWLCHSGPID